MLDPIDNRNIYFHAYLLTGTHVAILRNDPETHTAGLPRIRLIFIAL